MNLPEIAAGAVAKALLDNHGEGFLKRFCLALALALSLSGCSSDEAPTSVAKDATTAQPTAAPAASIDPAAATTAAEFQRRLTQYNGALLELSLSEGSLNARWKSGKCDLLEGETIDLLLSINRTQKASPNITARRECGGKTSTYALSATDFQRYRTGQINDAQVLKGIK